MIFKHQPRIVVSLSGVGVKPERRPGEFKISLPLYPSIVPHFPNFLDNVQLGKTLYYTSEAGLN